MSVNNKKKKIWKEHMVKFDIFNWLNKIKQHTFETRFIQVSEKESNGILKFHRKWCLNDKSITVDSYKKDLEILEKKIEKELKSFLLEKDEFIFARISSRSPKDASFNKTTLAYKRMNKIFMNKMKNIHKRSNLDRKRISSEEFNSLMESNIESLKIKTSKEVMDLILHSERVFSDILIYKEFKEFPLRLIIRKWENELKYKNEFRGFVRNNKLNGLTQYNNLCYYESLNERKKEYGQLILKFFNEEIKEKLKKFSKDYVIDFGILEESQKVIVIELNTSFVPSELEKDVIIYLYYKLGPSLGCFEESDMEILQNGPFTFKIVTKECKNQFNIKKWINNIPNDMKLEINLTKEIVLQNSGKCLVI